MEKQLVRILNELSVKCIKIQYLDFVDLSLSNSSCVISLPNTRTVLGLLIYNTILLKLVYMKKKDYVSAKIRQKMELLRQIFSRLFF